MDRRGPKETTLEEAREDLAKRDARIAELERAGVRQRHLYEISKLLLCFEAPEQTVPEVMALVAQTLPLRSAIFVLETVSSPQTIIVWHVEGEDPAGLLAAKARAQEMYGYFIRSGVDFDRKVATTLEFTLPLVGIPDRKPAARKTFVILPFVVGHGSIFGALQTEGAEPQLESDLIFINAVVNQLAIALARQAADRALRASEERLTGIVSIAADAIISADEAGRIVMYNAGAEQIFGWSRDEALGKQLDILLPERVRQAYRQRISNFAAGRETALKLDARSAVIVGLRKSGEEFPAEAAISKLKFRGEWLFTAILRDVTEQNRFEREQRLLAEMGASLASSLDLSQTLTNVAHLVMREFGDVCVIEFVDERGGLHRQDVSASDPSKMGIAQALKRLPLDRSRPHMTSLIVRSNQPQLITEVYPDTIAAFTQNEEHRRLWEAIAPTSMMGVPLIAGGGVCGALVVLSCSAERRYGDADLRLLVEVGRQAAFALENARLYQVAQRAVKARDDVLGIVAHDLRSPLGAILMQAELLRRPPPEPERRAGKPVELIQRAATRMDRLIGDLLDTTRMEAGRLSIESTLLPAGQIVAASVEAHEQLAVAHALELQLDLAADLPMIRADRERLLQVFENLIGNAVKFTGPGGRVTVGARSSEGGVLFWVADSGRGISSEDVPRLFDRFWQARHSEQRGAGLGLPIVKGIVEAHGGRIWVESTPGRGSTFYFTVPASPPQAS